MGEKGTDQEALSLGRTETVLSPAPAILCLSSNSIPLLFTVQSPRVRRCQVRTTWTFRHMGSGPSPGPASSLPLLSCLAPPAPLLLTPAPP